LTAKLSFSKTFSKNAKVKQPVVSKFQPVETTKVKQPVVSKFQPVQFFQQLFMKPIFSKD